MKSRRVFIFGLLCGWFVKVAIDKVYRDQEIEDVRNENASLKGYIRSLETKFQSRPLESASVAWTPAKSEPALSGSGKDDLKVIKGIGPAIENKLNDAGIDTFEALARLTVQELEDILGSTKRLVKDEGSLIAQAEQLAQQKDTR